MGPWKSESTWKLLHTTPIYIEFGVTIACFVPKQSPWSFNLDPWSLIHDPWSLIWSLILDLWSLIHDPSSIRVVAVDDRVGVFRVFHFGRGGGFHFLVYFFWGVSETSRRKKITCQLAEIGRGGPGGAFFFWVGRPLMGVEHGPPQVFCYSSTSFVLFVELPILDFVFYFFFLILFVGRGAGR